MVNFTPIQESNEFKDYIKDKEYINNVINDFTKP